MSGAGDPGARAFPLAVTRGVHTTGLFYDKALLDRAGLAAPRTIADLTAMVQPLAELGVAPLVHCSGDVFFNQMLVTWLLPMIAEREGDPLAFAERTVRGEIGYDAPEWIETFALIADLRTSGVLLEGSGALDYAGMQQLFLQGKAATTFNGSWLLPALQAGSRRCRLRAARRPAAAHRGRYPATTHPGLDRVRPARRDHPQPRAIAAFLEYASRPDVDEAVVAELQAYSPIVASNVAIEDPVAQEFLPMFEDAITPMDWLWEPEITAEIDNQVQALVQGAADPPPPAPPSRRSPSSCARPVAATTRDRSGRRTCRRSDAPSVATQAGQVDAWLIDATSPVLETKLYVPKPRRHPVARPRLSDRLGRMAETNLTLVSAPAGFGKTTLLAEWIARHRRSSAPRRGSRSTRVTASRPRSGRT